MAMLIWSHSTDVQKKPRHGRGTLKTCRAEGEGKGVSLLSTWCCWYFLDDCVVDSAGTEGVRCDSSGTLQTSPHIVGQELFSFWQTF